MPAKFIKRSLALFLVAVSMSCLNCSAVRNINLYSTSEEVQFGQAMDKEIRKEYKIMDDKRINSFLQSRGNKLAAVSGRPDLTYHFFGVNTEVINAFAIPAGYCYINLGLIRQSRTEAELLSVVAHEINHVVHRDGMKRLSQMQLATLVSEIALGNSASIQSMVANLFTSTGLLYYDREAERAADHDGLITLYKAGYNPEGMVQMFEMLQAAQNGPDAKGWEQLFSTHPVTSDRIQAAKTLIAELPPRPGLVKNSPEWTGLISYVRDKYPAPKK
jgi:beta-barrel assembly-enhancing protease